MDDGPVADTSSDEGDQAVGATSLDRAARVLRARWRSASLASGWRFPSDWALPEVDVVCAAVVHDGPTDAAVAGLGRARASSGAGLDETLTDLAALHAVLTTAHTEGLRRPDTDATPSRLVHATAVAWADVALDQLANTEVSDSLSGLPTAAYLRTRMAEIYRAAAARGVAVSQDYVLLVLSVDLGDLAGWPRLTMTIVAADVLRSVFDGGESIASLGPSTMAVLVDREDGVASTAVSLRRKLTEQLLVDPQLRDAVRPTIRVVRLPDTHDEACALLTRLARR